MLSSLPERRLTLQVNTNVDFSPAVPVLECWDRVDSRNYAGTLSLTNGGRTCQAWSTNYPHSHSNNRDELFPNDDSVAAARNYCRDPDGEGHPWCYTTNPDSPWQFCDVPVCKFVTMAYWL